MVYVKKFHERSEPCILKGILENPGRDKIIHTYTIILCLKVGFMLKFDAIYDFLARQKLV